MNRDLSEQLLETKRVSIWGGGYLGYTSIIRIQSAGFSVNLYELDGNRIEGLKSGSFPDVKQKESWAISGDIPSVDLSKLTICSSASQMFDSPVHIVSFPVVNLSNRNLLIGLAESFIKNRELIDEPLVLFQSAGVPRSIYKSFIRHLEKEGILCYYASAFRSDWVIEEFLLNKKSQVIAGYTKEGLERATIFFNLLGIDYSIISSIEEAEVYENAQNALHYTISTFINQLSLSYSGIDLRSMSKLLLKNIKTDKIAINIGSLKYKVANSLSQLMDGIPGDNYLTILKEAQNGNISVLLYYGDLLKQRDVKSITILGISAKGTFKDIRFSPALIFAEYLHRQGMDIYVNDPHYGKDDILQIVPFAKYLDLREERVESDALILFRDHSFYRSFSQKDIEHKGISSVKIIIDDTGIFQNFRFSENTLYHMPGDGKLIKLS
ncbi:MAG: UDP binding domain-containing protein [bacterium]